MFLYTAIHYIYRAGLKSLAVRMGNYFYPLVEETNDFYITAEDGELPMPCLCCRW